MTVRVYDPNNQMFEVSEARASELILNQGWTRQPTTTVAIDTPPVETVEDDWRLRYAGLPTLDPETVLTQTDDNEEPPAEEDPSEPVARRPRKR